MHRLKWLIGWLPNRRIQYLNMIEWITNWKVQHLKYLLGNDAKTEEGKTILWQQKKLILYCRALYHHHTPSGQLEEVLQFNVPTVHQVATMNGCHQDARHQGQQQMLCFLHDWFWWPNMATQVQRCHQQLQEIHPAWRQLYQTLNATNHCYHTFGVATCWLYQHWDHDGVGSTPKCGEPFCLL